MLLNFTLMLTLQNTGIIIDNIILVQNKRWKYGYRISIKEELHFP